MRKSCVAPVLSWTLITELVSLDATRLVRYTKLATFFEKHLQCLE